MIMLKHYQLLPLVSALLMPFSTLAGDVDRTLPWDARGELKVGITAGDIEIRGWNKDEVKLTGDFSGDDDRLTFKQSGKNIKLELEDENSWWGNNSSSNVDFVIYVPLQSNLDIEGTSLRIDVQKVNGNLEVNSVSGSITANGASSRVDIETVSGDVNLNGASGKIRLRTVSGDIQADVEAVTFDAKTVSGDIEGNIGSSEYASMLSVSGDVDLELSLIGDGRIDGQTVSGNLELYFKERVNADFELNTGPGGDIRNRLSEDRPQDSNHWGQELNFTVGDGDSTIELETMSGTIKLR